MKNMSRWKSFLSVLLPRLLGNVNVNNMSNFQFSIMKKKIKLKQGHFGVYHLQQPIKFDGLPSSYSNISVEALKFKKAPPYTKFDSLTVSGSLQKPASLGPPCNIAQHHLTDFGPFSLLKLWKYINQRYLQLSSVFPFKKCCAT